MPVFFWISISMSLLLSLFLSLSIRDVQGKLFSYPNPTLEQFLLP
jgi:hypothetical protein